MPELPEVENVRQGLLPRLTGQKIEHVHVYWDNIIDEPSVADFKEQLVGESFSNIGRRGKFLLFYLTDVTLLSHLRMEGKYELCAREELLTKHTHVVFELANGQDLRYHDVRKFGRMSLIPYGLEDENASLKKLGPEPNSPDFTVKYMTDYLSTRKKVIKNILLDQEFVAGLGNIYADEVLFKAYLHPSRRPQTLTETELEALRTQIIETLDRAVKAGGTTVRTYENSLGQPGTFQQELQIYGRDGEPCLRCGTPIEKIQVGGRGTHFCPHCQKV